MATKKQTKKLVPVPSADVYYTIYFYPKVLPDKAKDKLNKILSKDKRICSYLISPNDLIAITIDLEKYRTFDPIKIKAKYRSIIKNTIGRI